MISSLLKGTNTIKGAWCIKQSSSRDQCIWRDWHSPLSLSLGQCICASLIQIGSKVCRAGPTKIFVWLDPSNGHLLRWVGVLEVEHFDKMPSLCFTKNNNQNSNINREHDRIFKATTSFHIFVNSFFWPSSILRWPTHF